MSELGEVWGGGGEGEGSLVVDDDVVVFGGSGGLVGSKAGFGAGFGNIGGAITIIV